MAVRIKLTTKGLSEYLERVIEAGKEIDPAADRALAAGGPVLVEGMKARAPVGQAPDDPHPGHLRASLDMTEPKRDGNFHYIQVGIISKEAEVNRYGNAQEYGTSNMAAQPYIRPTMDADMGKARAAMRESLETDGMI